MFEEYFKYRKEEFQDELVTLFTDVTLKKDFKQYKKGMQFPFVAIDYGDGSAFFFEKDDSEDGVEVKFEIKV